MPESSFIGAAAVKRACDPCHRRKIKCIGDGTRPCKNCSSSGLTCTYNAIPQKKGPKGSRAKVISELRATQRQSQVTAAQHHDVAANITGFAPRILVSMDIITACVDYFFANLYPTQPILHRGMVANTIRQIDTNVEAYCLAMSLCAYMMIQPNIILPPSAFDDLEIVPQSTFQLGQLLLQETIKARKSYDYVESPSVWTVITSFFLFGSHFCLDKHNTAWFHLREATTFAQLMGMNEEVHYQTLDIVESSRRRRLYRLLFVTERAYALQKHRPLTLPATINLPALDEDLSDNAELNGFLYLVKLYRPFDDTFVGLWNKARTGCTSQFLVQLQQQLSEALPIYLHCTESQAVDLRCSQQWLRTMVWQLSISHGFLSSAAAEKAMFFNFPIEISRDLMASAGQFSHQALEVHGIGLIEKLFDIACTLTDVISCVPHDQNNYGFEYGPRDYLTQIMSLISSLRGGQQRYMPLLLEKVSESIPSMPLPSYTLRHARSQASSYEDIYEEGLAPSSGPESSATSSYESPLSATAKFGFPELHVVPPPPTSNYNTTSMQYSDLTVPAPLQTNEDPVMYGYPGASGHVKYDLGR